MVLWLPTEAGYLIPNGSDYSDWLDKSGNGNDGTQATASLQPPAATLVGRPCIEPATEYFLLPDMSPTGLNLSACEMFLVQEHPADPPTADSGTLKMGSGLIQHFTDYPSNNILESCGSTTRHGTGTPITAINVPTVYNVVSESGNFTTQLNGSQQFTTATNTPGFDSNVRYGSGIFSNSKKLGDLIIYDGALSAADHANVTNWAKDRFRIS